jgi:glycosyltransferase involved in cell wall biosynthesis
MKSPTMLFDKFFPWYSVHRNTIHLVGLSCNSIPPKKYGGIELIIGNLAKGFIEHDLKVRVYSPGALSIAGCYHSQTLAEPTLGIQESRVANTSEHLMRIQSELRAHCVLGDVVIFNHADHYRFLKKKLGRFFFAKVTSFEIAHWMDAGLYKNIIYPSKALKLLLKKDGFVIPHGEELSFAKANNVRGQHLFYAGRLTEDKGLRLALDACEALGCKLRIAGPYSSTDFFKEVVRHKSVDFLGELTYSELFEQYRMARAFVYMTQYEEPFGLAVVEAMAAGCPVITSGRGGTGETVLNGKTGFFCKNIPEIIDAYNKVESLNFSDIVGRAKLYSLENMIVSYIELIKIGKING